MSEDDRTDEFGNRIAHAIAGRRREPPRGFDERLRAAAMRPARIRWLLPAIAATAVAVMALALVFVWRGRADDDGRLGALARIDPPAPVPAGSPPPVSIPPLPAGPAARSGVIEFFDEYQTIIDGNVAGLALDATQAAKIRRIVDDHKRVLVGHLDENIKANADLMNQLVRPDPDTGLMLAAYDRMLAADSAARRSSMVARIAIRDALGPAQRDVVERRRVAPPVSTAPAPTPVRPGPRAKLKIMTDRAGADVTIDGARVGATPLAVELAHGRHALVIQLGGYLAIDRDLDITEDTTLRLNLIPAPATAGTGMLRVTARPYAKILVDGVLVGTTPLMTKLTAGRHRVTAEFPTSKETRTVTIVDGTATTLSLTDRMPPADGKLTNPFDPD